MASALPPSDPAAPAPRRPRRWAAVFGCLAGIAIGASFMLPWIQVDGASLEVLAERLETEAPEAATASEDAVARADYRLLLGRVHAHGALRGVDLVTWSRIARRHGTARAGEAAPAAAPPGLLGALRILLLALIVAGPVVAVLFFFGGLRRAPAPVLAGSLLAGTLATALAAAVHLATRDVLQTGLGAGVVLLAAGGVVGLLVGIFGVTRRTLAPAYVLGLAGLLGIAWLVRQALDGAVP